MGEAETNSCVTIDFDHRDRESTFCPWPRWVQLRAEAPIAWTEQYGGVFVLSRYREVFEVLRDPQTFSNKQVNIPRKPTPPLPPVMFDPPEHRGYREIVNPLFSPERIAQLEPWIRETANKCIDPLLQGQSFDVAVDVAAPVMYAITMRVLGITAAPPGLEQWVRDLALNRGDTALAAQRIAEFLSAEVKRRTETAGDDAISALMKARYEGSRPLTHEEIVNTAFLLVLAGLDTTTSAMAGVAWYLVQNPEAQDTLAAADERAWRLALDEFVRWTSPVAANGRLVARDTSFHGCPMHKDAAMLLLYGSANRDEKEFPEPDEVVLDRFPNRHVGFGMGVHRCLGSHLAKATMRAVIQGLLKGLRNFRLESPDTVVWETGASTRGIRRLPLVRK